jgi:hypothetical protein
MITSCNSSGLCEYQWKAAREHLQSRTDLASKAHFWRAFELASGYGAHSSDFVPGKSAQRRRRVFSVSFASLRPTLASGGCHRPPPCGSHRPSVFVSTVEACVLLGAPLWPAGSSNATGPARGRSSSQSLQRACAESVQPCPSRRTCHSHSGRCAPRARC